MIYKAFFPRDVFAEIDRLQRDMQQFYDTSPSIRGFARGGYPALNVAGTPKSIEIYAFAPGLNPDKTDVQIEKGVLTIAGERADVLPPENDKSTLHINERFVGRFRRVVALPDDIDPTDVQAKYTDGVLHISVKRSEANQPRRIAIQ